MDRPGHETVEFFTGVEVEKTSAFGQHTLFVVGVHDTQVILAHAFNNACPHIYLGANHSFEPTDTWQDMIMSLVSEGVLVTLDVDVQYAAWVLETGATEHNNFIPMISVKLPYIQQLGYNAVVKIDDTDFDHSNPGVWCHSVHDLMDRSKYTDWSAYKQDKQLD